MRRSEPMYGGKYSAKTTARGSGIAVTSSAISGLVTVALKEESSELGRRGEDTGDDCAPCGERNDKRSPDVDLWTETCPHPNRVARSHDPAVSIAVRADVQTSCTDEHPTVVVSSCQRDERISFRKSDCLPEPRRDEPRRCDPHHTARRDATRRDRQRRRAVRDHARIAARVERDARRPLGSARRD